MKNNSFVIALGVAIPVIAIIILIILVNSSGNLVKTNYRILYTKSSVDCGTRSFYTDYITQKIERSAPRICGNRIVSEVDAPSNPLYIINPTTGEFAETNFETASKYKIQKGVSPDGVGYEVKNRYNSDGITEILTLGIARRKYPEDVSITIQKGPWARDVEIPKTEEINYIYDVSVLGWIVE